MGDFLDIFSISKWYIILILHVYQFRLKSRNSIFCRGHTHDIYITWIVKPQSIISAKPCSWIQRRLSRRSCLLSGQLGDRAQTEFPFLNFFHHFVFEFQEFPFLSRFRTPKELFLKKNSPTRPGGFYVVHHFSSFVARSSAVTGFS